MLTPGIFQFARASSLRVVDHLCDVYFRDIYAGDEELKLFINSQYPMANKLFYVYVFVFPIFPVICLRCASSEIAAKLSFGKRNRFFARKFLAEEKIWRQTICPYETQKMTC